MEAPPRLTPGAVQAIAELPDGAETGNPVLQVLELRPVTTTNSERFRMALSDGVHAQQSMLATALNHLVTAGALRPGAIVHIVDMTCSTIQKRRIIIVVKLDILQSVCTIIGTPRMYEAKSVTKGQEPNLPHNAAQPNNYSGGPGMRGSSVVTRAEQATNTQSYGGPYNGVQAIMGSSIGQKDELGPNNVLAGGSYGTISAQNTMNANVLQPKSQQPLLNTHQNQTVVDPIAGSGVAAPANKYGCPAQPSYQQKPGPNNVLAGGSYGTMSAQNTMNANVLQTKSQQPLLNTHQNQTVVGPITGSGVAAPANTHGYPAQPSYQQKPGPNNVLAGVSYGTMSAHNTMNANVLQPKSQQLLLNTHQNQTVVDPIAGSGVAAPVNKYGCPAQPSYQQKTVSYMNRGPVAKREAASRVIPISALNPYQNRWTIKARVTAKAEPKHYVSVRGSGKVFSFDLLDAHGGEIRATCFNETLDRFFNLIEVGKVYLVSRGSLKPADRRYNHLNSEYEINMDSLTSVDICSGDDSSIPEQRFSFRQIEEIENMDKDTIVDLLGVITSVSPYVTITRKNGTEVKKRTLQLKDMSCRSVDITFWGNLCDAEGQQLQLQCDSGFTPILALKGVRVNDFGGRSVSTSSSSLLKINPEFPEAQRLREWYITEGKTVVYVSLSQEYSSMGRSDVRKTTSQIKDEDLGRSEKPDWITVKGAISHLNTESFSYPACTLELNGKRCTKKVTSIGDGTWNCEKCDQSSPNCEHRYLVLCQIQDHTGTTYATAFQEAGEEIFGMKAQELVNIRDVEQDDVRFAAIIQGIRWQQYLFKLRVKEETFNDEARVKCGIVKAEKLDTPKECAFLLGAIENLLVDGLSSNKCGVNGSVVPNAGFTNTEATQSVVTSNNAYAANTGQFGQQASISGASHGSSYGFSAGPTGLCFRCNHPGHFASECPTLSSAPSAAGLCFKCNQSGHIARDCPEQRRSQM